MKKRKGEDSVPAAARFVAKPWRVVVVCVNRGRGPKAQRRTMMETRVKPENSGLSGLSSKSLSAIGSCHHCLELWKNS